MRVTFVLPTVGLSGGNRVIAVYADRLIRRGHEVTLISLPGRKIGILDKLRTLVRKGK